MVSTFYPFSMKNILCSASGMKNTTVQVLENSVEIIRPDSLLLKLAKRTPVHSIPFSNIASLDFERAKPILGGKLEIKVFGGNIEEQEIIWFKKSEEENFVKVFGVLQEKQREITGEEESIQCPKCRSKQIQIGKRGFKTGRAVGIGLLTFGLGGIIAGAAGMNTMVCTCLKCGNQWKVGKN